MALPKKNYLHVAKDYYDNFFLDSNEDKSKLQLWLGDVTMLVTSKFSNAQLGHVLLKCFA